MFHPPPTPFVLSTNDVHECLNYFLQNSDLSTTLVICSTRDAFLSALLRSQHTSNYPGCDTSSPCTLPEEQSQYRYLLEPTIGLLFRARAIQLAFCPTLQHLRAYLSTYATQRPSGRPPIPPSSDTFTAQGPQEENFSVLALFNSITLHRSTLEHSAQGISRTLAIAVEAAARANVQLVLAEYGEASEPRQDVERMPSIWDEQVALLNMAVTTLRNVDGGFLSRTIPVRRVVATWCRFEDEVANNVTSYRDI